MNQQAPSTNNGLESINRTIKEFGTLRERKDLRYFFSLLETQIIRSWSVKRDTAAVNTKLLIQRTSRLPTSGLMKRKNH